MVDYSVNLLRWRYFDTISDLLFNNVLGSALASGLTSRLIRRMSYKEHFLASNNTKDSDISNFNFGFKSDITPPKRNILMHLKTSYMEV